jgi:hypothetical protein
MGLQLRSSATRTDARANVDGAEQSATLVEPKPRHESLTPGLAPRVARVGAQGRLEGELRTIVTDLLGPNESDEFPAACSDWVAATTAVVVSRVSDSALEALVQGLDSLLVAVPPDVARHLDRAKARHEVGFD